MKIVLGRWLSSLSVLSAALVLCTAVHAQDTNKADKSAAASGDALPDIVELEAFGGVSLWGTVNRGLGEKLVTGGDFGGRAAWNFSQYVGLELSYSYMVNNVRLVAPIAPGLPSYSFGNRIHYPALNLVFDFTPRGSRIQPYLTVGGGGAEFVPTNRAEYLARLPTTNNTFHSANLNDNLQVGLNYGGGVKFHLSDHVGLRIDARGFWSRNPTFDLPNYNTGGLYIPAKGHINGLQATAGLVFYMGQSKCPEMPPAPPAPAPLPTPTITGMEGTICQGKPVTLHANITAPAGHPLSYAWTMNGQAQGSDSPDFTFTPNNSGSFNVQVTVTDKAPAPAPMERPKKFPVRCWVQPTPPPPVAPVSATATLTVADDTPQLSAVSASPTELSCAANPGTHTAQLTGTATPAACGGNLTYKWTVSEGSVANDSSANATFDASTLNFEGGAQGQTKTVTATLTVTSETGKTASQTTTITVNCKPQFVRMDDVIFAKNNARVNNCGKRVLIDDAAPRMASGDYDIVLVGHRDNDEAANARAATTRGRGRRRAAAANALDEQRALNAAAVLSGGTGTCAKVDPSRIKVDWVGTDQTSESRVGQCGTSNIKERRGSVTTEADKNRRVEVYLVPRNSTSMPPAVKEAKPLPMDTMKSLGCPK